MLSPHLPFAVTNRHLVAVILLDKLNDNTFKLIALTPTMLLQNDFSKKEIYLLEDVDPRRDSEHFMFILILLYAINKLSMSRAWQPVRVKFNYRPP